MMAVLRNGLLLAVVSGALWGVLAMIVIGITFALVSGAPAQPAVNAAALAGLLGALVLMAREPAQRTPAVRAVSAAVVLVVLFVASFAHPFGLPLDVAPLWQILAVLLIVGAVSFTNWNKHYPVAMAEDGRLFWPRVEAADDGAGSRIVMGKVPSGGSSGGGGTTAPALLVLALGAAALRRRAAR